LPELLRIATGNVWYGFQKSATGTVDSRSASSFRLRTRFESS